MNKKVEQIKAWAQENYESGGYGVQTLVECYSDAELNADFKNLTEAKQFAKLKTEQCEDACAGGW